MKTKILADFQICNSVPLMQNIDLTEKTLKNTKLIITYKYG